MTIDFYECSSLFDKASIVLLAVTILLALFSGFKVYSNEAESSQRSPFLREIMGGVDVFFTSRFLNETGKRWRIPYVYSVLYIACWALYAYFFIEC